MAKDITAHDATTVLSSIFKAPKVVSAVISLSWTNITGGVPRTYNLFNSNFDDPNDPVPGLSSGFNIPTGSDTLTIKVNNPAQNFKHDYNGAATGGTIDIKTKIIYSND